MLNNSIPRAVDLIPAKMLEQPLPLDAYYLALKAFLLLAIPCGLIAAGAFVAVIVLAQRGAPIELLFILVVLGAFMVGLVVIGYLMLEDTRADYRQRQDTYAHSIAVVGVILQNITINNVDARGRGNTVNVAPGETQAAAQAQPILDAATTQVFEVATVIADKAIGAWLENGGKRARPKPFSAQVMGAELSIGGETWQAAIELLDAARVLHNGASAAAWRVLVDDRKRALAQLETEMRRRGYYSVRADGRRAWYKAIPAQGS